MAVLVVGECLGVMEREAGREGNKWTETVIAVIDGMNVERIPVASVEKFRGVLPEPGERIALSCSVRSYARRDGGAGHSFKAFGRVPHVEAVLASEAVDVRSA